MNFAKMGDRTFRHELDVLFEDNRGPIHRVAYRITHNREDAEDVLQTIFFKVARSFLAGKPPSGLRENPQAYLSQAATHQAINVLRARDRRVERDKELESQSEIPAVEVGEGNRMKVILGVRGVIARMDPMSVEVLNLHYKEGHDCRTIAKMTGKTIYAVWSKLRQARKEFREQIRIEEERRETEEKKHAAIDGPVFPNTLEARDGSGRGPGVEPSAGGA